MNCPQCNGQCYLEDNSLITRCDNCGWYEGHEVDAKIDAEMEAYYDDDFMTGFQR